MDTTPSSQSVICFGVFDTDVRTGELRKNGVRIKIQELLFRALKLLLSRPNHVFTREEFRQALWPDGVFVDFDHGISSAINRLRDALGDSASNPIFVETVERRGYRWIAPTHYSEHRGQIRASEWRPYRMPGRSPPGNRFSLRDGNGFSPCPCWQWFSCWAFL